MMQRRLPIRLAVALPSISTPSTLSSVAALPVTQRHIRAVNLSPRRISTRSLSTSPALHIKQFPPRPKPPPDSEIEESYLKGSGPGGQKINKTNSAVQIKHIPTGIVVKCQATRSRSQNRNEARRILAKKIDDFVNGDASRSTLVADVKRKKSASAAKKSRRKYRRLEDEKEVAAALDEVDCLTEGAEVEEPTSGGAEDSVISDQQGARQDFQPSLDKAAASHTTPEPPSSSKR